MIEEEPPDRRTVAELLRATLRRLRMRQADLCRRTGLSSKHVNQLAQGTVGMTVEMALLLERATDVPAQVWMGAEFNRRRIQGHHVATRGQITCAVAVALREVGPVDGASAAARVALAAVEHLLDQLGIQVWDGVTSPCVTECGSPAGGELTSE